MRIQKTADLARIVKTRRQAQSLSQQNVADAVGITRQSLARIESGHGGVSFDTVLRIFERLGVDLEATSAEKHRIVNPTPSPSVNSVEEVASAAPDRYRDIDTAGIAAAGAAATCDIDTSALTSAALAAYRNIDISAITAAAAAATKNIDASALVSRWQTTLNDLSSELRETAARTGSELSANEARRAVISAAIEAGNPDRKDSAAAEANTRQTSDGANDG